MRVKLDENLGVSAQALLRQHGHDVQRVTDENLSGAPNDVVWAHVCAEQRLFITNNLRFSDRRVYTPGSHPGIVLLRLRSRGRSAAVDESKTRVRNL